MRTAMLLIAMCTLTATIPAHSARKDKAAKGQQIFQQLCIGCHGPDARAQSEMGKKVQAADLTSAVVQDQSDSDLLKVIRNGRGKMPSWASRLNDSEIHAVLAYVRSLRAKPQSFLTRPKSDRAFTQSRPESE